MPSKGVKNNNLIMVVTSDSNICEEKLLYQREKLKISLTNAQSLKIKELPVVLEHNQLASL